MCVVVQQRWDFCFTLPIFVLIMCKDVIEASPVAAGVKLALGANLEKYSNADRFHTLVLRLAKLLVSSSEEEHPTICADYLLKYGLFQHSHISHVLKNYRLMGVIAGLAEIPILRTWISKHLTVHYLHKPPASCEVPLFFFFVNQSNLTLL